MKYIITTPFIDRPHVHRLWLRHFEKLDIPKKDCLVLWYDISDNPLVEFQLKRWMDTHKDEFLGFKYVKHSPEIVVKEYGGNLDKRYAIVKTMTELLKLKNEMLKEYKIKADRVLIEDDILFEADTFQKLKKLATFSKDVWMTTGVNYPKKEGTDFHYLIMWDMVQQKEFSGAHAQVEDRRTVIRVVKIEEEQERGIRDLVATSTGFVYIKQEAEEGYKPNVLKVVHDANGRVMVNGQDMNLGWWITQVNKKQLLLDWSCKFPHVSNEYPLRLYRTDLCKTEIYNYSADDEIFTIASNITNNVAPAELALLHALASNTKNGSIIELGTHTGKSAAIMAHAIRDRDGFIICMDRFGKSRGWHLDKGKEYKDTLINAKENIEKLRLSHKVIFVKGNFEDTQKIIHTKADLIFIDGDHTKEGVLLNFEFALNNLAKEGIIAFHDYNAVSWKEVKDTVDKLKQEYGLTQVGKAGSLIAFKVPEEYTHGMDKK